MLFCTFLTGNNLFNFYFPFRQLQPFLFSKYFCDKAAEINKKNFQQIQVKENKSDFLNLKFNPTSFVFRFIIFYYLCKRKLIF